MKNQVMVKYLRQYNICYAAVKNNMGCYHSSFV